MRVSTRLFLICLLALFVVVLLAMRPISAAFPTDIQQDKPLALSSVSDSMGDPIFASISSRTVDTRVINLTNPAGNPGITEVLLSIPIASVSSEPTGTIPIYGGVPDCEVSACTATTPGISFLNGYSLAYSDTSNGGSGKVILPAGSTILLTLTLVPELQTTNVSSADSFSLGVSVYENSGTQSLIHLDPISIYETTSNVVSVKDPSSSIQTVGVSFKFGGGDYQGGIPLAVSAFSKESTPIVTIYPLTFISSPDDILTSITVIDETNGTLWLTISGYGTKSLHDAGGILSGSSTDAIVVNTSSSPTSSTTSSITTTAQTTTTNISSTTTTQPTLNTTSTTATTTTTRNYTSSTATSTTTQPTTMTSSYTTITPTTTQSATTNIQPTTTSQQITTTSTTVQPATTPTISTTASTSSTIPASTVASSSSTTSYPSTTTELIIGIIVAGVMIAALANVFRAKYTK